MRQRWKWVMTSKTQRGRRERQIDGGKQKSETRPMRENDG